jgi:hypothetical protein
MRVEGADCPECDGSGIIAWTPYDEQAKFANCPTCKGLGAARRKVSTMRTVSSSLSITKVCGENEMEADIGVFSGISNEAYHAGPGVSSSQLKAVGESMADYLWPRRKESTAMALGTAAHMAILEPDEFEARVIVSPQIDKRTKAGKAEYAEFIERYGAGIESGEIMELTPAIFAQALQIRDAVHGHPIAAKLFVDGESEVSAFWTDADTGILCKCRPDWLRHDGMEVSLKTARRADLSGFMKDAYAYGYHISTAFYRDGLDALDVAHQPTVHVVVETDDPRPERVAVYVMDDLFIEKGRDAYREALRKIATQAASPKDYWAGYPLEIQTLEAPRWA